MPPSGRSRRFGALRDGALRDGALSVGAQVLILTSIAVLLGAAFCAAGALIKHASPGFELRIIGHVDQGSTGTRTAIARALSVAGSQGVLIPVAVALCLLLAVRRQLPTVAMIVASAIGGIALSDTVKAIVDRPRPNVIHLVHVTSSSFPSGHAAQTAAILPALAIGATALGARRTAALVVAAIGSIAIGASRVALGVHYPSDVVAGWLLGGGWFLMTHHVVIGSRRLSAPTGARIA